MNQSHFHRIEGNKNSGQAFLVLAVILVALNLRPAITSVGPLIGVIRDDLGLANWSVALLTSLPLLAFMLVSPLAPKIAGRLRSERTLMLGLLVIALGIVLRSFPMLVYLFAGTFIIGCGIAVCNVLLPSVIRDKFPLKVGLMTSVYTMFMTLMATIASGVSFPLADGLNLGWNHSLLLWLFPAVIGFVAWLAIVMRTRPVPSAQEEVAATSVQSRGNIWTDPLAWKVTVFMGLQSMTFYVLLSWLPEILYFNGMERSEAGLILSYFQLLGIPMSFLVPMLATRMKRQSPIVWVVNTMFALGLLILLLFQSFASTILATTLMGIGSGSNFALALTFLSIRARDAKDVAELSGMAQSIGYCIAALGPILLGLLFDLSQQWTFPLLLLILSVLILTYFGHHAGKDRYVFARRG